MTQISTPTTQGPSAQTLEFLKKFARSYRPGHQVGKYVITATGEVKPLGVC